MSNINQSLIRIFKNSEDNVVLAYGSSHGCGIQSVDLELIVIDQADIEYVAKALLDFKLIDQNNGDQDGES